VLVRIIELGCEALERSLEETIQPTPERPATPAPERTPVEPLAPIKPTQEPAKHLIDISEVWAEYKALGYKQVAQLLYDRGIYRAKGKDGTERPMNRGTLKKMIDRCEERGLL
jgi:hypothetical protein